MDSTTNQTPQPTPLTGPVEPPKKRRRARAVYTLSSELASERDTVIEKLGESRALELMLSVIRRAGLNIFDQVQAARHRMHVAAGARTYPSIAMHISDFVGYAKMELGQPVNTVTSILREPTVTQSARKPFSVVPEPAKVEAPVEVVDSEFEEVEPARTMPEPVPPVSTSAIVPLSFKGTAIRTADEFMNATDMWVAAGSPKGQRPTDYLETKEALALVAYLSANLEGAKSHFDIYRTKKGGVGGGGQTEFHWQLGLGYAKYLSGEFHAWCNTIVRSHMTGEQPPAPQPRQVEPSDDIELVLQASLDARRQLKRLAASNEAALEKVAQLADTKADRAELEALKAELATRTGSPNYGDHLTGVEQIHHLHALVMARLKLDEHQTWSRIYDHHDRMFGTAIRGLSKRWNKHDNRPTRSIVAACEAHGKLGDVIHAAKSLLPSVTQH